MEEKPKIAFDAIGKPLTRQDARLKVTGAAKYSAEFDLPNLAHGFIVESSTARGRIRRIDTGAAKKANGVIEVVTHLNAPRLFPPPVMASGTKLTGEGGISEDQQPLQEAEIVFAGQPVAFVVAETYEQARYAATLVKVEYEQEEAVTTLEAGLPNATLPENFGGSPSEALQVTRGKGSDAINSAPVHIEHTYQTPIEHHCPIEQTAVIAWWDAGKLMVYESTRFVDGAQKVYAESWGIPVDSVRVAAYFIGGAFGSKGFQFRNGLITSLAARVVSRPVKLNLTRQQMFTLAGQRPHTVQTVALGAGTDGKLQAIRHDTETHTSRISGFVEPSGRPTKVMYATPNLSIAHKLAHLDMPSPCPMRAPGESTGMWALEAAMDELAVELKMDPIALRLQSYAETDPQTGKPWSSKHLRECYTQGAERFGWEKRKAAPRSNRTGRYLIGHGMATTMYPAEQRRAGATVILSADGRAIVRSATHDQGNGAYTTFRQIAADALGMDIENVHFELGDTNFPMAPAAGGSVTTVTVGEAVVKAGQEVRHKLMGLASDDAQSPLHGQPLEALEVKHGRVFVKAQPSVGEDFGAILRRAKKDPLVSEGMGEPEADKREKYSFFSFGAVFAEVRVDEELGAARVTRVSGVYDMGRIINPQMARNQFHGAVMLAVGSALMEQTEFDPRSGRPVIRNLSDYHIAGITDTPEIDIQFLNIPDPNLGELGARGLGEMGVVGTIAAIGNAIYNATGKRLRDLPMTPDKIMAS